ncbi:hypothetical protein LQV63_10110 [Paenibacillus profundus]|uniref:Uncharacterized protein n=1 Tax=Paenibacillus profundus TaxID=1173085 RepID=A0ABS8YDP5_9BACL|nr:hypothetical protein [Paenibacillus profundus]MCE5169667.1 hypothetical protein [Paenibacillus profundus]
MKQYVSKHDLLFVGKGYEITAELRRLLIRDGQSSLLSHTLQKQATRVHKKK